MSEIHHEGMMTREELAELLRVDIETVDAMVKRGTLPKPVKLSRKCVRFWRAQVLEALAQAQVQ